MRRAIISAVAALAFASVAHAAPPQAVQAYTLDAKGKCHAPNGQTVAMASCRQALLPNCQPGKSKPCGNTCIAKGTVCHKP